MSNGISPKWFINKEDFKSILRHTIYPILGGAVVAAIDSYQVGGFNREVMYNAFSIALITGIGQTVRKYISESTYAR